MFPSFSHGLLVRGSPYHRFAPGALAQEHSAHATQRSSHGGEGKLRAAPPLLVRKGV